MSNNQNHKTQFAMRINLAATIQGLKKGQYVVLSIAGEDKHTTIASVRATIHRIRNKYQRTYKTETIEDGIKFKVTRII